MIDSERLWQNLIGFEEGVNTLSQIRADWVYLWAVCVCEIVGTFFLYAALWSGDVSTVYLLSNHWMKHQAPKTFQGWAGIKTVQKHNLIVFISCNKYN